MKHAHSHHDRYGGWLAGLVVVVVAVAVTLWMAWRLGGAVTAPSDLRFRAPSAPSRSMPNPQPPPLPTSPRPG